jgi:hypothetical protein
MTRSIIVGFAGVLCCSACGGGDPEDELKNTGDSGACTVVDDQGDKRCLESIEPNAVVGSIKATCENGSPRGTFSSSCPEGAVFTCQIRNPGGSTTTAFTYRLEPGTEGFVRQVCVANGGTPGPSGT